MAVLELQTVLGTGATTMNIHEHRKPCFCGNDQTTGGHQHESVVTQLAEGACPFNEYGQHRWLPWLEINSGHSWVTRCLACGRVEQWDK